LKGGRRRLGLETNRVISTAELERMMKLQDVILKALAQKIVSFREKGVLS
jgi:hypothetical protein